MKRLLVLCIIALCFGIMGGENAHSYTVTQLTNNAYHDNVPKVNDNGSVVWNGDIGSLVWQGDNEIFLYDGTSTTQLTNNSYNERDPQINNNGDVVWIVEYGGLDNEIFIARQTTAPVPEPTTMLLLGTGLIGLVGFRRKFKKS